jgi:ferredoxin-NADP reductase/DMSO/TMAO reductase YedYZ heme-binding membrane subunit
MVGSALLAVMVVLAAGVPVIERTFGRPRLLRWHVTVGAVSFSLVVVHVFLAVAASALVEGDSAFEAAWRLLSDFPGTTLAAVGVALLVLVVSTSRRTARAARRRDAWHLLHLYGYLGVFLALPHQILTSTPPAALYWLALYVVAAGAVIGWRVYGPLARSLRHQLVVSEIHQDSAATVTVVLRGRRLDELAAAPGSTLRMRFLDGRGWFAVHPGSVMAAANGSRLRVTVPTTTADRRPAGVARGTWVLVEGPFGVVTADTLTRGRLAVFAAGTGIVPVRALLDDMPFEHGDVVVIHRVHDSSHVPFAAELADLAERRGVETVRLDGPRPEDRRSWLPASAADRISDSDAVVHLVADIADRDVVVSGPPAWVDLVVAAVRAAGVPSDQVHADSFAW